jgi:zinc transporter ZupT
MCKYSSVSHSFPSAHNQVPAREKCRKIPKSLSSQISKHNPRMNFNAIVLATITCFSTLLGGAFAARRRKNIGILGAFAAGVLITTSLLDLLPQTFRLATSVNVPLEDVMALTVVGFLFLYVISRLISGHVFSKDGEYVEIKHPLGGLSQRRNFRYTASSMAWQSVLVLRLTSI